MEADAKPLKVDARLLEYRMDSRLMWLVVVGWIIQAVRWTSRVRRARIQVTIQLENRSRFPNESWQSTGVSPEFAASVGEAFVGRITWLPNHHFLPDDSLRFLLIGEEIGLLDVAFGIERVLDISLGKGLCDVRTFGDLVVLARTAPTRTPKPRTPVHRNRAYLLAIICALAICAGFWLPIATGQMGWISIMLAGIFGFYVYGNKALHG